MDKDLADARAESEFKQLHKRKTWSKRDQADQDGWERHDNEGHLILIDENYATCWLCHPELDDE